jgi:hypothetical protein
MNRVQRRLRRALLIALCVAASSTAIAGGALAATDGIPRPPGAIDHRGYELVSQPDKNGNQVHLVSPLASTGDRLMYEVIGGMPGANTGTRPKMLAVRTSTGWVSRNMLPPLAEQAAENYYPVARTADLSGWIAAAFDGRGQTAASSDASIVRLDDAGGQTLLRTFPIWFGNGGPEVVASADLRHAFVNVQKGKDPSLAQPVANGQVGYVYDVGDGTPRLVSVLPSGSPPGCGVPTSTFFRAFATSVASVTEHWVSTDGSKAFFETRGDDCSAPLQLYRRDLATDTTTLVSGPVVGGGPDLGVDRFLSASADGGTVWYRTASQLDPGDANGHLDVYRWTADGGNECLTCVVPDANLQPGFGSFVNAVVAQNGSRVYFTSPDQLADAPAPGSAFAPNLYVLREPSGALHFVAQVTGIAARPVDNGELTPDGTTLLFLSNQASLDARSGASNGGFFQYYRYDDRDDSVTCVSCPPAGAATTDVSSLVGAGGFTTVSDDVRAMSDDGHIVVFPTWDPLVPEDVNQSLDLYEWHDGTVKLITSGLVHYTVAFAPVLGSVSPDGRDIVFIAPDLLTPDAQDAAAKLYDARVDGGFPAPAGGPPAPCDGDQCQGTPSAATRLLDPASASLLSSGNLASVAARRASFRVGRVSAAQRARLVRTGRITLAVRVSGAGRVAAVAQAVLGKRLRTVARAARSASRGGRLTLTLRLSHAARSQLARSGRLRLVIGVRFSKAPTGARLVLSLKSTAHGR